MRILIVEDNQADQELLLELLQDQFLQEAKFRVATSLESALSYLQRTLDEAPFFDVVILDLKLPDSTGKETFRAIHRVHPKMPIVVMSHNKDPELALDLIREGAHDFILKDYTNPIAIFRRVLFAVERERMKGLEPSP